MCGVVGVWGYRAGAGSVDVADVDAMRDAMDARGPDGAGTWVADDGRLALAHRRLAIIGLGEQGHQPMVLDRPCLRDPDGPGPGRGQLAITYNGELYEHDWARRWAYVVAESFGMV